MAVCDRAYVMRGKTIVGELARGDLTEENILRLAMHHGLSGTARTPVAAGPAMPGDAYIPRVLCAGFAFSRGLHQRGEPHEHPECSPPYLLLLALP